MKVITPLLLTVFASTGLQAQKGVLDEYLHQAIENNQSLFQRKLALKERASEVASAKSMFSPQLSFQANYTLASGGRLIEFPVGDLLNPVYGTLNQLTESENFPTNIENEEIQFLPHHFQETKLRLIQPIFNSDLYYNLQAQKNLLKVEEAKVTAYQQELVFLVKTAYYNYLQSVEAVNTYQLHLRTVEKLLETNRKLVAQGQKTPDVVYRTQIEINQLKVDQNASIELRQNAITYFNFLLNRPLDAGIEIDTNLELTALNPAASEGGKRPEIDMIEAAQMAQINNIERLGAQRMPTVSAVVDAGFQGFGYDFEEQEFALMQVGLEWNLFSGFHRKNQQAAAKIQLEQLESQETELTQQIALQVAMAREQYHRAWLQYQLQQATVLSAEKAYRIMEKRYAQGQVLLIELIDARNTYQTEQQALIISKYQLPIAQASINRALAL